MSISRWMDKDICIYTCNGIVFKHKNAIWAIWMDLEIIILSKVSQKKKDKYHMISFICGIENITQMNLSTKQKQTHRCRDQTCGCQGDGVGRGMDWEFGVGSVQFSSVTLSRVQLFATPWIAARQAALSITSSQSSPKLVHRVSDTIQASHPLSSPSPPAPNPSQHQSLFQWVNPSHEVAKVLEFQL